MPGAPEGVRLCLCGDVMTGRGVDQILARPGGRRLIEEGVQDATEYVAVAERKNGPIPRPVPPAYIWGDALAVLERAAPDLRIVNLETSITTRDDYWPGKSIHYRMHPDNVDCLRAARVDACSLANNHVLDFGVAGLAETIETLRRAGIRHAGAGRTLEEAAAPVTLTTKAARVHVLACGTESSGIPRAWAARPGRAGVHVLPDLSNATADAIGAHVRPLKEAGGIVIASIHWGGNWGYEVPRGQVDFAHRLIDRGIDVIHGHSSHHARPIEVYHDRLILYGCGDCITDYEGIEPFEPYRDDLPLLYLPELGLDGALAAMSMVPLQIRQMSLRLASTADTEWIGGTLDQISAGSGCRIEREDSRLVLRWNA